MHAQGLGLGPAQKQQQPGSTATTTSTTASVQTNTDPTQAQSQSSSTTSKASSTSSSSGVSGSTVTKLGLSSQLKDAVDSYSDSEQTNPVVALQVALVPMLSPPPPNPHIPMLLESWSLHLPPLTLIHSIFLTPSPVLTLALTLVLTLTLALALALSLPTGGR